MLHSKALRPDDQLAFTCITQMALQAALHSWPQQDSTLCQPFRQAALGQYNLTCHWKLSLDHLLSPADRSMLRLISAAQLICH